MEDLVAAKIVGFVDCKPCILLCMAQSNVLIDKIEISSPYL